MGTFQIKAFFIKLSDRIKEYISKIQKKRDEKPLLFDILFLFLLPITLVYLEIMLAKYAEYLSSPLLIPNVILFSLGIGFLLNIICLLFSSKRISGWLCFVFAEILTVFYLIQYFTDGVYTVFMSLKAVVLGAGGVAGEFGDVVVGLIFGNVGLILLYHIPALIILILNLIKVCGFNRNKQWLLSSVLISVFLTSVGADGMISSEIAKEQYTYNFVYDTAVRRFGVITANYLDIKYSVSGVPDTPWSYIASEPDEDLHVEKNILELNWDAINSAKTDKTVQTLLSTISNSSGTNKNDLTGLFEGKNLVFITGETFCQALIREDYFPTLYKMANEGIKFNSFYQPFWGGSTSSGECSLLTGLIPLDGTSTILNTIGHDNSYTLASMLSAEGYQVNAYHNGNYDFYSRNITHPSLGFSKFVAYGNGMEGYLTGAKPRSDVEMFNFIKKDIDYTKPFYVYAMSYAGHMPYSYADHWVAYKHIKDIGTIYNEYPTYVSAYYAANIDLEIALKEYIEYLDEQGVLDDTVFVISGDHYCYTFDYLNPYMNDHVYLPQLLGHDVNNIADRDENALIIWSPCLEEMDLEINDVVCSIDVVPTVANLFGLDYDSRFYAGHDVFSNATALVPWPDGSFLTNKGFYNATTGEFTAVDGEDVSDAYIKKVKDTVNNKLYYSRYAIRNDLFSYIYPHVVSGTDKE